MESTLPIFVNNIGNPVCPWFSRKPKEQNCQRDSGVEPTTRTHCPNTVSAFTLKALPQSLHGVMPNMQGTGSEAVSEIREMMRIWILLRRTHLSCRFSIWKGPLMNNPLMSSFHYDNHSGVSPLTTTKQFMIHAVIGYHVILSSFHCIRICFVIWLSYISPLSFTKAYDAFYHFRNCLSSQPGSRCRPPWSVKSKKKTRGTRQE